MYCEISDVQMYLQKLITVGSNNLGTPEPLRISSNCSQNTSTDHYTTQEVVKYIQVAEQYINSRLNPYYVTPLRRIKEVETCIKNNITAGNNKQIQINDNAAFSIGQNIRMQDSCSYESAKITALTGFDYITVDTIANNYSSSDTLISIVSLPPPIPAMTARIAASYMIARLFTGEQAPDVSNYDKFLRNETKHEMDDLLVGEIILLGQDLTGRRFARGQLFDGWYNPSKELQKGEEKE